MYIYFALASTNYVASSDTYILDETGAQIRGLTITIFLYGAYKLAHIMNTSAPIKTAMELTIKNVKTSNISLAL